MTMIINVINKTKKEKTNTQFVITYTKQARSKQDKTRYFLWKDYFSQKNSFPESNPFYDKN